MKNWVAHHIMQVNNDTRGWGQKVIGQRELKKLPTYWTGLLLEDVAEKCPDLWAEDHEGLEADVNVLEHRWLGVGPEGRRRRRRRRWRRRRRKVRESGFTIRHWKSKNESKLLPAQLNRTLRSKKTNAESWFTVSSWPRSSQLNNWTRVFASSRRCRWSSPWPSRRRSRGHGVSRVRQSEVDAVARLSTTFAETFDGFRRKTLTRLKKNYKSTRLVKIFDSSRHNFDTNQVERLWADTTHEIGP